ncbi:unnamed protein product [Phytomonas sp. Hart1]|nr:unnamed protein product [Phytomonas sp. Hart1]|eukprot:CCW69638.1 unnamed protein product [Phytomonas sp. isolate Hart1]
MTRNFSTFLGLVELLVFLIFDFIYAHALSSHKNNHPELEECAPQDSPDLDTLKVLDSLAAEVVEIYKYQRHRLTGSNTHYSYVENDYVTLEVNPRNPPADGLSSDGLFAPSPRRPVSALHATVVLCGIAAPIFTLLTLLFPSAFSWAFFVFPTWLSYVFVAPGLGATALYVARVLMLLELVEVSKTQWISMMWFRLDFMFIMSTVAFLGVGAWLVAICILSVSIYSVHRLIKMEKHLNQVQRDTQLVRGEVDVSRVLKPGTAESKKATGIIDGYSALAS